jgi:hypothetical protein
MSISDDSTLSAQIARGIKTKDWIWKTKNGEKLKAAAFLRHKTPPRPEDRMVEISIDFVDEPAVIDKLLNRRNVAEHGAAVIRIPVSLDQLTDADRAMVGIERKGIPGNAHHGNILLHADLGEDVELVVAATYALYAEIRKAAR